MAEKTRAQRRDTAKLFAAVNEVLAVLKEKADKFRSKNIRKRIRKTDRN